MENIPLNLQPVFVYVIYFLKSAFKNNFDIEKLTTIFSIFEFLLKNRRFKRLCMLLMFGN